MGVSFDGTTSSTRWLVVDCANDPLGHPNSEVGADPVRPYVSISIAHGIRRFEFMIHGDESDEEADSPAFVRRMLAQMVPDPERVDIIRHRVYTHHSRIAGAFRAGRLMIAGDAAHLMPVWQGQGYNSGIRDAANLGWKLAAVVNGQAEDALLDSYDVERRKHARAMIDLSTLVGRVISPTNRRVAALRDKLHPRCVAGAHLEAVRARDAVQADAALRTGSGCPRRAPRGELADGHAVHPAPGRHPRPAERATRRRARAPVSPCCAGATIHAHYWATRPSRAGRRLGANFVAARPMTQLRWAGHDDPDVVIVGDRTGALKAWFDATHGFGAVPSPRQVYRRRVHRCARSRDERVAVQGPLSDPGRRYRCH